VQRKQIKPHSRSLNRRMLELLIERGPLMADEISAALKLPTKHVAASMRHYIKEGAVLAREVRTRHAKPTNEYRVAPRQRDAMVPPRWALAADGAFVDLASPTREEISAPRARALVDFIRKLDEGQA